MKINKDFEERLKVIQNLSIELETQLHYLSNDLPAGSVDLAENLFCIVDRDGNEYDLEIGDISNGELRNAILKI